MNSLSLVLSFVLFLSDGKISLCDCETAVTIAHRAHAANLHIARHANAKRFESPRAQCSSDNIPKQKEIRDIVARIAQHRTKDTPPSRCLTRNKPAVPQYDWDIGRTDEYENRSRSAGLQRSRHRYKTVVQDGRTVRTISHHAEGAALTPSLGPPQFFEFETA